MPIHETVWLSEANNLEGFTGMKKKDKKVETTNLPTFGWLEAYKDKRNQREPARKEREMSGREALLDK